MKALPRVFMQGFFCATLCSLLFLLPQFVYAEEITCTTCHEELTIGKSVHAAVSMGCESCHTAVDAADVPHRMNNRNPRGLSAKMRDLCFSCHDKQPFSKSTVHGAILLGCTSCHNSHASDSERLLKSPVPGLCLTCHADRFKAGTEGEHMPIDNAPCTTCHNPHSSDAPKLLGSRWPAQSADRPVIAKR